MKGKYSVVYYNLRDQNNPDKGYIEFKRISDIVQADAEDLLAKEQTRKQTGFNPDTKNNVVIMYRKVHNKLKQIMKV